MRGRITTLIGSVAVVLYGCAAQTRVGISPEIRAELALLHDEVRAGRDANSTLVFALAVGGLALCALAYPIGKLIWLWGGSARRRLTRKRPEEQPDELDCHRSTR